MPITPKPLNQGQVAALAGVNQRWITKLHRMVEGEPPRSDDKSYPCKAIGDWLRKRQRADMGIGDDGEIYDYATERGRLTHHQANNESLKEAQLRGDLVPRDMVIATWQQLVSAARAKLLALPTKSAAAALAATSMSEIEDVIKQQVHEALAELDNEGLPHRPQGTKGGSKGLGSTAKPNGKSVGRSVQKAKPGSKRGTRTVAN